MAATNTQWYPGRALIKKIDVVKNTGASFDVTKLVNEINITTSMYDYTSLCELTFMDARNFISNFPLEPGDSFRFNVDYKDETHEYEFYLKKIKNISHSDKERGYTVEAVPKLAFTSLSKKWSNAYFGSSSEMARLIFDENDGGEVLVWDASKGAKWFVSPNWSPIKALGYLAGESISTDGKNRFVFFQDGQLRYNFCPIETLGKMYSQPVWKYTYNQSTTNPETGTPDEEKVMTTAFEMKYLDQYDFPDAINKGALATAVVQTDVTKKSLNLWAYNYWDQFDQNFHLNEKPLWNYVECSPGKIGLRNHYNRYDFGNDYQLEDDSITRPSLVSSGQLFNITVKGNPVVETGMVIELIVPPPEPEATLNGGKRANFDTTYSGKFYVLGKRDMYRIRDGEKQTALTLVKESLVQSDAT